MQGKWLAFPFIPFSESSLFNGLRRIQIKKILPTVTRVAGCRRSGSNGALPPLRRQAIAGHGGLIPAEIICSTIFWFWQ
jgi:hypothetical protein